MMQVRVFSKILFISAIAWTGAKAARDTVSVYFPFNKSTLTDSAAALLDNAIYRAILSEKQPLRIIGYTDEVGGDGYNLSLSKQRALRVKEYLVQSGFAAQNIVLITGKGESGAQRGAGPDGTPADRRVDIVHSGGKPVIPQKPAPAVKPPTWNAGVKTPDHKLSPKDISTMIEGETLVLENIYFFTGRHTVRPESDEALDELYTALQAAPGIRIRIEGHVCCVPNNWDAVDEDTHRGDLSINRAITIRDYLVGRGIAAGRLDYQGYGHRRPRVSPELSEEDAQKNRRVEIRIIK